MGLLLLGVLSGVSTFSALGLSPNEALADTRAVQFHVTQGDAASEQVLAHLDDYYRERSPSVKVRSADATAVSALEGRWTLKIPALGDLGVIHVDFKSSKICDNMIFFISDAGTSHRIRPGFMTADGSAVQLSIYPGDKEFSVHVVRQRSGLFEGEAKTPENGNTYPATLAPENIASSITVKAVHASLNGLPVPISQQPGKWMVRDPDLSQVDGALFNHPQADGFTGCFPMDHSTSFTYEKTPIFAMHYVGPDPTVKHFMIQNGAQWVSQDGPFTYMMQGKYGSVELFSDSAR